MKCSDVILALEKQAPPGYACEWDNVGLLVGSATKEIKKVSIALDATDRAIAEAEASGADLLLTHHPMIFRGLKRVTEDDFTGRRVIALIRADICCYAMHTNFDVAGMADLAAERLGMRGLAPLEVTCTVDGTEQGIGRTGELARDMTLAECCALVKQAFSLEHVAVFGDLDKTVRRAAVCPGAGKGDTDYAVKSGADVYITGDIDHHTGIDACARGMAVIDAGHYGIEHIFTDYMQQYIRKELPQLEVAVSGSASPVQIV